MNKILFINGQTQQVADILAGMGREGFELRTLPAGAEAAEKVANLQDTDFLVLHPAALSGDILRRSKNLRLIQLLTAGYDKVDIVTAAELGIPVATNGGANAWAVAEHAVALILALYKKLLACDASLRAGTWRKPINGFNTFELAGKTVGIVGAGNIGKKVATRLKGFETEIVYHDQRPAPELDEKLGARQLPLAELLRTADIVCLHAPLLDSTRGMIGARELAAMKDSALLINTSRSELVDEAALVAALREGRIAGAGVDVYPVEPVPAGHPLATLDNVVLTPHSAGHSYEGWWRRSRNAWHNILKVAAGEKPDFVVNAAR